MRNISLHFLLSYQYLAEHSETIINHRAAHDLRVCVLAAFACMDVCSSV